MEKEANSREVDAVIAILADAGIESRAVEHCGSAGCPVCTPVLDRAA